MKLTLERKKRTDRSTIGRLFIDGVAECFTLEDKDRDLTSQMSAASISKIKVFAHTAIPSGTYEVIISFSQRFDKPLPLLLNVPGFSGVRIHSGNCPQDTEGCILTGTAQGEDWITQSRDAFCRLMTKLEVAIKKEKIYITIQ